VQDATAFAIETILELPLGVFKNIWIQHPFDPVESGILSWASALNPVIDDSLMVIVLCPAFYCAGDHLPQYWLPFPHFHCFAVGYGKESTLTQGSQNILEFWAAHLSFSNLAFSCPQLGHHTHSIANKPEVKNSDI